MVLNKGFLTFFSILIKDSLFIIKMRTLETSKNIQNILYLRARNLLLRFNSDEKNVNKIFQRISEFDFIVFV